MTSTGGGLARPGVALLGAVFGGLAVAAGAFGAHGLQGVLPPDRLQVFETAARYQMFHALALLALGIARFGRGDGAARWAAGLFVSGTILFCGSLYCLALSGTRAWGFVTPFGGVAWIAGWAMLALAAARERG
jgi:uncharacterized membrane protein YgdD (TMEM256/DUF423 family)